MTTGEKIKALRKQFGLTQTELGEKLGVKKNAVSKWECGRVDDIPKSKIKAMCMLFNVPTSYLIDEDEKTLSGLSKSKVSDEDIKFALFGGRGEITDEMYNEVRSFAEYVRQREEKKTLTSLFRDHDRPASGSVLKAASPVMTPKIFRDDDKENGDK